MILYPDELINKKYTKPWSFVMMDAYGTPNTIIGTDNEWWYAYFDKGNFTIKVKKKTDVITAWKEGKAEGPFGD